LADIVEGTDAFVQVAVLNYRWIAINGASADEFAKFYGKRPRPGDNMLDLLADRPEQAVAVKVVWGRAFAGEEFTQIDEFADRGIDRRWYEMKFNVLRDQNGRQIGAYQFVYDVTERLRDQARLAEAEAALRQAQKLDAMGQPGAWPTTSTIWSRRSLAPSTCFTAKRSAASANSATSPALSSRRSAPKSWCSGSLPS